MKKKLLILSIIIITGQLLTSPTAQAQQPNEDVIKHLQIVAADSNVYSPYTNEDTLLNNVASIIKVVLGLLGTIFVILMIYAGILWMTAGGNDTQVKKAQNIIQRAVIGLIIVVLAYAITYFIFKELGGLGPA
ncbi:MAG TPA: hypothetical protein P5194_01190 [Patescibacteria group bacterium]|nr:hypothetical protein [bacterium]HRT11143.1 hypothetical protein [Patescibacteria group bacterium]HRU89982.1 hypothetical protein [Patescibacteria group bacterium]